MASVNTSSIKPSDESNLPSEGVRTAITFGLIVYLFLLAVGWLTSSSMERSPLFERFHDTMLQPYNALLLTEAYEFSHVGDVRLQVGAVVRANLKMPGDEKPSSTLIFPVPEKLKEPRQQYLQRLANDAAVLNINQNTIAADRLMKVVGAEILRETGATSAELTCYLPNEYDESEELFRRPPTERFDLKGGDSAVPSKYTALFAASIYSLGNDGVTYSRADAAALSAPVPRKVSPSKSGSSGSPAPKSVPPPPGNEGTDAVPATPTRESLK